MPDSAMTSAERKQYFENFLRQILIGATGDEATTTAVLLARRGVVQGKSLVTTPELMTEAIYALNSGEVSEEGFHYHDKARLSHGISSEFNLALEIIEQTLDGQHPTISPDILLLINGLDMFADTQNLSDRASATLAVTERLDGAAITAGMEEVQQYFGDGNIRGVMSDDAVDLRKVIFLKAILQAHLDKGTLPERNQQTVARSLIEKLNISFEKLISSTNLTQDYVSFKKEINGIVSAVETVFAKDKTLNWLSNARSQRPQPAMAAPAQSASLYSYLTYPFKATYDYAIEHFTDLNLDSFCKNNPEKSVVVNMKESVNELMGVYSGKHSKFDNLLTKFTSRHHIDMANELIATINSELGDDLEALERIEKMLATLRGVAELKAEYNKSGSFIKRLDTLINHIQVLKSSLLEIDPLDTDNNEHDAPAPL